MKTITYLWDENCFDEIECNGGCGCFVASKNACDLKSGKFSLGDELGACVLKLPFSSISTPRYLYEEANDTALPVKHKGCKGFTIEFLLRLNKTICVLSTENSNPHISLHSVQCFKNLRKQLYCDLRRVTEREGQTHTSSANIAALTQAEDRRAGGMRSLI